MKRMFSSLASYFFRLAVSLANFILFDSKYLGSKTNFLGFPMDTSNETEKGKVGRPRLPITDQERQERHREAMRRYWQRNKIILSQKAKMKRKVARDAV
jgi:hypothetical protein